MKKNIAVIGCGYWGKNLVRNFYELGCLVAICDPDIDLAKAISETYKVKNLSFNNILKDQSIEGVVLAVPASLHAKMSIKALNAKKHVFVEKPISLNQSEAKKMIECSKNNNMHLMVGHLLQYHPIFIMVKKLVVDNQLGKLKYVYSNRLSLGKVRSEEDVIWSFAPHDISMILSLVQEPVKSVKSKINSIIREDIADNAIIHLEFESGLKAHVSVSWINPFKEQKLVIIGDKAMAVFDDTKPWDEKLGIYDHKISKDGYQTYTDKADIKYVNVKYAEPLKEECLYFLNLIAGNVPPLTDGLEGAKVLSVLNQSSYKN